MIEDALSYPTADDEWTERIVVGGLLVLASPLVIPAIALYGYLVRVLRSVAAGESVAPEFDDWEELLVDGVKALVIGLAYALVPLVAFGVLFSVVGIGFVAAAAGESAAGVGIGVVFLAVLGVVAFAVSLVVAYVVPAALARFALDGSLEAAFEFRALFDAVTTSDYALGWVLAAVVSIVVGAVASALTIVLVGFFVSFWSQVVSTYLFGRGYVDATTRQPDLSVDNIA